MDLTDLTWVDIFRLFIEQGLWGIAAAFLAIGVVIGVVGTRLYYKKLRNVKMENDLASAEKALEEARHERDDYREKYDALKKEVSATEDRIYARGALDGGAGAKPDVLASIREIHNETASDRGEVRRKIKTAD